ncbi:hypothetical protein BGZ83_005775 [Gryganskiella cystojenkinii]|nr:hypothetical protein BGZ83_005775 [Gryganskiella cystojenkinii]
MVSQSSYRYWKQTVAFFAIISFIVDIAYYICLARYEAITADLLGWMDWAQIVLTGFLFVATIWAVQGKPVLHRYLRAFLMLFFSVFLLYIGLWAVHREVIYSYSYGLPFSCDYVLCRVAWADIFLGIILGFLVVIDVGLTLRYGPQLSATAANGLNPNHANVVFVSPIYAPGVQPQPGTYAQSIYDPMLQQPQQQQPYYQQQHQQYPMQTIQHPPYQQPYASQPSPVPGQYQQPVLSYQPYTSQSSPVPPQY